MLEQLDIELNEQGIHIAFVELRTRLHHLVHRYGLFATLDRDHFYDTIDEALAEIAAERHPTRDCAGPPRAGSSAGSSAHRSPATGRSTSASARSCSGSVPSRRSTRATVRASSTR
jgi:hypothetical protein